MEIHNIEGNQSENVSQHSSPRSFREVFSKVIRIVYTGYGVIVFVLLFFICLPFLLLPLLSKKSFKYIGIINRQWAKALFFLIGIPVKIQFNFPRNPNQQYIFCPNHFSYLDIPAMGLNPHNTIFVGKSSVEKVPVFGYMYGKLHITVDRARLKSRYHTLLQSMQAIDEGKSLVIFPEGGIFSEKIPELAPLKDGAMRIAIEKQIPIVPVTIHNNWIILPPDEFLLNWHPLKMIFHEPIETTGMSLNEVRSLKEKLNSLLQQELNKRVAGTKE